MTDHLVRRITPALATAAFLAAAAVGCTPMIDGPGLEKQIKDKSAQNGLTLASVSCPTGQKAQQGATFTCTSTTSDGDTITWNVTQTDNQGNVDYKTQQVQDAKNLGDQVEPQLKANSGNTVDMKCDSKWIVLKAGAKFTCDATVDGNPGKVVCTFSDDKNYDCKLQ
jgi:hypothetical protein